MSWEGIEEYNNMKGRRRQDGIQKTLDFLLFNCINFTETKTKNIVSIKTNEGIILLSLVRKKGTSKFSL